MKSVDVEYTASWSCPRCDSLVDDNEYELEDRETIITCREDIDRGGDHFEECGCEYSVSR
jgi:hypothetical protein